jgi:hypothetical protein
VNATVGLEGVSAGLAVQNIQKRASRVTADLLDGSGQLLARRIIKLPANRYFVREISELFAMPYPAGSSVRVRGTRPVQVMGIAVSASGAASPVLPQ